MSYPIRRDLEAFKDEIKPPHIIIMHSQNLITNEGYIDGSVRRGNYKYTFGKWEAYLMKYVNKKRLPMHRFFEFVDSDYVSIEGLDISRRSYFLENMTNEGVIERGHTDDFLVVVGENFELDVPDDRFYEVLTERILSPMFHMFNLTLDNVYIYDEILTEKFLLDSPERTNSGFEFHPMSMWNDIRFKENFTKVFKAKQFRRRF